MDGPGWVCGSCACLLLYLSLPPSLPPSLIDQALTTIIVLVGLARAKSSNKVDMSERLTK